MNLKETIIVFIIFSFMALCLIAIYGSLAKYFYEKNNVVLESFKDSRKIKPSKFRFVFSWLIYSLYFLIPAILIVWFLKIGSILVFTLLCLLNILMFAPGYYPYYSLAIYNGKVNGAALWGWKWKRVEIDLKEIDKEKVLRQYLGRMLGVIILYSTGKGKILTFGLDNAQLLEVLNRQTVSVNN